MPVCTSSSTNSVPYLRHSACASPRYSGDGTRMPASPWIGSTMNAAMLFVDSFFRTTSTQLILERSDNLWMVVPRVMNAVAGEKIEVAAAILRQQLHALAARITNIHLEQIQQPDPLRIHISFIAGMRRKWNRRLSH